jgi:hypothetical protein
MKYRDSLRFELDRLALAVNRIKHEILGSGLGRFFVKTLDWLASRLSKESD